jgi:hypothetical protein
MSACGCVDVQASTSFTSLRRPAPPHPLRAAPPPRKGVAAPRGSLRNGRYAIPCHFPWHFDTSHCLRLAPHATTPRPAVHTQTMPQHNATVALKCSTSCPLAHAPPLHTHTHTHTHTHEAQRGRGGIDGRLSTFLPPLRHCIAIAHRALASPPRASCLNRLAVSHPSCDMRPSHSFASPESLHQSHRCASTLLLGAHAASLANIDFCRASPATRWPPSPRCGSRSLICQPLARGKSV